MIKNDVISTQRDNLCETQETRKARFYKGYRGCGKLSDVLEFTSNATHMQQVCNKDIDMYRTFFSRDTGECPFLCLNLINRIYKLLYIKVGIHFLCECHCT